jgi:hypothetical protein
VKSSPPEIVIAPEFGSAGSWAAAGEARHMSRAAAATIDFPNGRTARIGNI